jgi:hypothetical protein
MFWTRRKTERREPVLAAGSLFDLKLDPRDRARRYEAAVAEEAEAPPP